jgi:copper transport protein
VLARQVAIWLARFALYVGLFVGVGGAFFPAWIANAPAGALPRKAATAALLAVPIVALASLAVQGLDLLDAPAAALFSAAPWQAAFGTTYAWTLAIAIGASMLALAGGRALTALALAAVGIALAASGHASDAQPQYITRPAVFIHALAVTVWVGALVPLAANTSTETLRRFSRVAPLPVALLIVTGVTLAAIQIGTPAAIPATAYGRIFAAKMAVVAMLLLVAAWNRWRLTPSANHRALARTVVIEVALVVIVLGLVAGWRFTPPPRALAAAVAAREPLHVHIHGEKAMADVSISPGRVGPVSISLAIQDSAFGPLDAKAVTVSLSNPVAGIEPIRRAAVHLDGVIWRVDDLILPAPGVWQVKVDVLVTEFSQVTLEAPVTVPP